MSFILQDVRFAARIFSRTPALTAFIILLLALGIGANSAMFSVVDRLLLHPVRYLDPDKLVFVWSRGPQDEVGRLSPGDFMDLRAQSKSLAEISAWVPASFVVLGGDRPQQVSGAKVTASFFRTLGVKPVLGRMFLPDEDGLQNPANAGHSAVVSYRYWRQNLGADPNVLGRTLKVDSVSYTVIGVAPDDFHFRWRPDDLWIPVSLNIHERSYRAIMAIARLTGTSAQAAAEMNVIARSLAESYPKSDKGWRLEVEAFKDRLLNQTFRRRLLLLFGAVGTVLLLACTNIAGLLLARAAARQKEIAVRISLGADTARLAAQLLTESALLALFGGSLGLAIAWFLTKLAPKFVPPDAIPGGPLELSMPVVWFSLALSAATCILIGLAPALGVARSEQQTSLKQSGRGATAGRASKRAGQTIVAADVAAAVILFAGAWLMTSSLRKLIDVEPGFNPSNSLTVRLFLPSKYNSAQALRFYRTGLERIARMPSVQGATIGTSLPGLPDMGVNFDRDDTSRSVAEWPTAAYVAVGPEYLSMVRIPLLRGRYFSESDKENTTLVAIVSESLATRYFPNENPIGKRLVVSRPVPSQSTDEIVKLEIVGVVGNVRFFNPLALPLPMIYVPHPQNPFSHGVWFVARTAADPAALASAIRTEFMAIDKEQPVDQIGTLDQMLDTYLAQPKFQTGLMGSFALIALLLAVLGIYGVNAYAVTQRQNELGLRMALGASRGQVLRLVIGQGMIPTGIGIVIGVLGTAAMTSLLRSVLVGTDALDPLAFLGAALVLTLAAALACYFPARRATKIDPAIILRAD